MTEHFPRFQTSISAQISPRSNLTGLMAELDITSLIQNKKNFRFRDMLSIAWRLSLPSMIAQLSSIVMQYIDAAMVGSLGADSSAAIGLVASSTWLFGGVLFASIYGFSVQIANSVGAGDSARSRKVFSMGLRAVAFFSLLLMLLGVSISGILPRLLGADEIICHISGDYFRIYSLFIPVSACTYYCGSALQATGNMRIPGILESVMCILDIFYNFLFIFPTRDFVFGVFHFKIFGLGLGVTGASLGTGMSQLTVAIVLFYYAVNKTDKLKISLMNFEKFDSKILKKALQISIPTAFEQIVLCGAMVMSTHIVAPLGTISIAANSFAITAESLCYMPGYGLEGSATTLVGQCLGAGRNRLAKSFAWITVCLGMVIMAVCGFLMYFLCPYIFAFLTPDEAVRAVSIQILRIELWAEPLFGLSMIAAGALRGASDTLIPSIMTFASIWGVRITLALILVGSYGIVGIWTAMCLELMIRGIIFAVRLKTIKFQS